LQLLIAILADSSSLEITQDVADFLPYQSEFFSTNFTTIHPQILLVVTEKNTRKVRKNYAVLETVTLALLLFSVHLHNRNRDF